MNKYIKFMAFAMMAVFSLAFVSCGDDDDEPSASGSQLVINGKSYNISFDNQTGVMWNAAPFNSVIQFGTGKYGALSSDGNLYTFGFPAFDEEKDIEPTVGLDLSKLEYRLIGEVVSNFTLFVDNDVECSYVSGSVVIAEINKSQESITLKFNDLKMAKGGTSYTFSGTVKLPFLPDL